MEGYGGSFVCAEPGDSEPRVPDSFRSDHIPAKGAKPATMQAAKNSGPQAPRDNRRD
jgi:hypothetical protein